MTYSLSYQATEKWCNITNKLIAKYKSMTEKDPKRAFIELTQIEGLLLAGGILTRADLDDSPYFLAENESEIKSEIYYGPNPSTNIYRVLNDKVTELTIINKSQEATKFLIDTKYVSRLRKMSWSYQKGTTSPITSNKGAWREKVFDATNQKYIQKYVSLKVYLFGYGSRIKGENPYDHREECFNVDPECSSVW